MTRFFYNAVLSAFIFILLTTLPVIANTAIVQGKNKDPFSSPAAKYISATDQQEIRGILRAFNTFCAGSKKAVLYISEKALPKNKLNGLQKQYGKETIILFLSFSPDPFIPGGLSARIQIPSLGKDIEGLVLSDIPKDINVVLSNVPVPVNKRLEGQQ